MLGVVSFSDKACLVVGTKPDLSNLITHTLRQIGFVNVTKADSAEHGFLLLTKSNIDLVILLDIPADQTAELLRRIRAHNLPTISAVPVICVSDAWSGDQIRDLRDAGVSVLATLPLTMRTLLKHATRALNPREFVSSPTYRGPCRRTGANLNYVGPKRRAKDAKDAKDGKSSSPPPPPPPPSAAEAVVPPRPPQRPVAGAPTERPAEPAAMATPELRQTKIVVDNSYDTAMEVDALSSQLGAATDTRQRGALCREIAQTSERMINLMSLADQRVREFGCSEALVGRLESIRTTIVRNAEGLAESGARRVIDYGGRIVSGRVGVPLGVGVALAHQIGRIDAIVDIIGGIDAMSANCKAAVLQAREVAAAAAALETNSSVVIPDLEQPRGRRKSREG